MEVTCKKCGGPLKLTERESIVKCKFCDSSLYVDFKGTTLTYVVDPLVTERGIEGLIRKGLADREIAADATVSNIKLIYLPYWEIKTADPNNKAVYVMGANPPLLSVEDISPITGQRRFLDDAAEPGRELVEPEISVEDLSFSDIESSALIFYPVYIVTYQWGGEKYEAAIDAVESNLVADRFPPSLTKDIDRGFAYAAIFAFLGFLVVGAVLPGGLSLLAFIAAGFGMRLIINKKVLAGGGGA